MIAQVVFSQQLQGHLIPQIGVMNTYQGKSQFIGINGLIGNQYRVTQHLDTNMLLGLGYYYDGIKKKSYDLSYGIDAFYLFETKVKGVVRQELLFDNLSYRYNIVNIPVYAALKTAIKNQPSQYELTFTLGVGPNVILTSQYVEHPLDHMTIPDNAFSGQTKVALSGMAGMGIKFNHFIDQYPIECGYRFFYLNSGQLKRNSNQLGSNMTTGSSYANAILCSISA